MRRDNKRGKRSKVYGPYLNKRTGKYDVISITAEGDRSHRSCDTAGEAEALVRDFQVALGIEEDVITVAGALDEYEEWQKTRGRKPKKLRSVVTSMYRLRGILGKVIDRRVVAVSQSVSGERYEDYAGKRKADTHQAALSEASRFWRWCIEKGYTKVNPWLRIEPTGRVSKGKMQLRVDEARKFQAKCLELGDDGAIASLMCLLLGLRASEVVERVGRDVDDGGRLLWIDNSKTEAGRRVVEVPIVLADALVRIGSIPGRGEGRIFPHSRYWLRDQVRRICKLAGVPVVCPHGLRGTHASLAMQAGASSVLVAASLGHASPAVTLQHYAQAGAVANGRQGKVISILEGRK